MPRTYLVMCGPDQSGTAGAPNPVVRAVAELDAALDAIAATGPHTVAMLDVWSVDDPPHGLHLGVGLPGRSFVWHVGAAGIALAYNPTLPAPPAPQATQPVGSGFHSELVAVPRLVTAGQARQAARDYVTTGRRSEGVAWAPAGTGLQAGWAVLLGMVRFADLVEVLSGLLYHRLDLDQAQLIAEHLYTGEADEAADGPAAGHRATAAGGRHTVGERATGPPDTPGTRAGRYAMRRTSGQLRATGAGAMTWDTVAGGRGPCEGWGYASRPGDRCGGGTGRAGPRHRRGAAAGTA